MQKLYKLRRMLAQNPELGVGVLELLDEIIKDAEKKTVSDYEQSVHVKIQKELNKCFN